jgi:branched-chain amino acid transport system substrate-binding protein
MGHSGVKLLYVCLTLILLEFISTGKVVSQDLNNSAKTIKIGLLIPEKGSMAAVQGAELAIREANEKGGLNGFRFQLIVRSMEGPWGTGSKEAVNLIFEEKVWALLGAHDGRNAHIVEQAATKSIVVFVSAWASDPTLSQAFVPWFFNCVPNDNQQASSLIEGIFNKGNFKKVAVVSGDDYDSKMTLNCFLKASAKSGRQDPVQFKYEDYNLDLNDLSDGIIRTKADCIVLFCPPKAAIRVTRYLILKKVNLPVYGSLMIMNENELSASDFGVYDNTVSVPSGNWTGKENISFRKEFQKTFKKIPGMVASYSYDGMNVLIEAVRKAGSNDLDVIRKTLADIHFNGATGPIQFDNKGNRLGIFEIMKTKNGVPESSD